MSRRNHQYRVRLNEKEYLDLQFLIEHGVNPAKLFRDAIALKTLEIPERGQRRKQTIDTCEEAHKLYDIFNTIPVDTTIRYCEPSIDFDILKKSANAVATAFSAAVTALYEEEEE